jgi:hypothetical protein
MIPEEFIQEMAWRRALGIAFLEISAVIYISYLGLIVLFFRKSEIVIGIVCAVCAILCLAQPIGVLIALVFGWSLSMADQSVYGAMVGSSCPCSPERRRTYSAQATRC